MLVAATEYILKNIYFNIRNQSLSLLLNDPITLHGHVSIRINKYRYYQQKRGLARFPAVVSLTCIKCSAAMSICEI